jgi:prevent-host-death family protein
MSGEKIWQATEARAQLPAVMQAALSGTPQIIRKRSGEEVVVVSRTDYERLKPTLKDYLLRSAGAAGGDDDAALRLALRRLRAIGAVGLVPRRGARRA